MQRVLQNTYIQAILVFLAIVGAVSLYQNGRYYLQQDSSLVESDTTSMDEMDMSGATSNESDAIDYTGTHIMPDGTVMTGGGLTIPEAVILENGDIEMPDGTILTPVGDFRP